MKALIDRTYGAFRDRFGAYPSSGSRAGTAVAPGRINIIGEHTDYNDGFVLPMAIDRHVAVAFEATETGLIEIWSEHAGEAGLIDMKRLRQPDQSTWLVYAAGMAWALGEAGFEIPGGRLAVCSDLPVGAGVSSSAAFEIAVGLALATIADADLPPVGIARMAHKSDHEFVGIPSGIMDQFASACCTEDHALLLDCRDETFTQEPVPDRAALIVIDTAKRRELVEGAYAARVESCRRAVTALRRRFRSVDSLRTASLDQLRAVQPHIDDVIFRRARHVITEMERPAGVAGSFRANDLETAGRLMNDSHRSLALDYEVSCAELDVAVSIAREHPGCLGARLTGAGFGGCAIALCEKEAAAEIAESVHRRYRDRFGAGEAYEVSASSGARIVS